MEKKTINLLKAKKAPPTFWENLYDWVTNTCRIIVIITELFVLVAFGWRFWLDRRLNDIQEDIEMKGEILKDLSSQEDEIRLLQKKINTYKELWEQGSNYTPVLKEVDSYIPPGVEDLSVSVNNKKGGRVLSISGKVERAEVSNLENDLKDSSNFSDVVLATIEKESGKENKYTFSITAKIIYQGARNPLSKNETTES